MYTLSDGWYPQKRIIFVAYYLCFFYFPICCCVCSFVDLYNLQYCTLHAVLLYSLLFRWCPQATATTHPIKQNRFNRLLYFEVLYVIQRIHFHHTSKMYLVHGYYPQQFHFLTIVCLVFHKSKSDQQTTRPKTTFFFLGWAGEEAKWKEDLQKQTRRIIKKRFVCY